MVSLSSCESELHSIVSAMSDAIFVRRCIEFVLQTTIMQVHYTDSSSARQLVNRQGVGKIHTDPHDVQHRGYRHKMPCEEKTSGFNG